MKSPLPKIFIAVSCAAGMLSAAPAIAVGPIGFYFMSQAFQALSSKTFGAFGLLSPNPTPPGMAASLGAAEIINENLPLRTEDGFTMLVARAPAPGALEMIVLAPKESQPSAEQLDQTWGPGLADMFCGGSDTLWRRWVAVGGSVGVSVQTSSGELIRQYGVSRSDCAAIRRG